MLIMGCVGFALNIIAAVCLNGTWPSLYWTCVPLTALSDALRAQGATGRQDVRRRKWESDSGVRGRLLRSLPPWKLH